MEPSTGEVSVPRDVLYAYPHSNAVSPLKKFTLFQPATSKSEAMERHPPLSIVIRSEQNRTHPQITCLSDACLNLCLPS